MQTSTIKPCPFCGGKADLDYSEETGYFISCEHEVGCYLAGMSPRGGYPASVIKGQWDRRYSEHE